MAATEISRSPAGNSGLNPLSRTQGILVETMQLVEPKKSQDPVPNHILESKIYSKVTQNDWFEARPAVLHFGGIEIGKTQKQVLKLANVSTEVQRLHIIPPQSKYFSIKYTKQERLVPGLTLDCVVEFTPDEWRYYYDCIRIHCKGEENLLIPIHAYPVMNTDDFPAKFNFPSTPVGERATRIIPLRCMAPIDFEFQIQMLQPHPAFTVDPLIGIVPAYGEIEVAVTFSPSEFSTAHMKMQLLVSQFNAKPLTCHVTGISTPGLAKELSEAKSREGTEEILDPRCITPVERAREKRKSRKEKTNTGLSNSTKKEVEKDGIRFPSDLDTPYAVVQVLNQQPGKLRIKDIREAVVAKKNKDQTKMTRQMKEAMFEVAVREDVYEERQNQLRWQVKLGDNPMTNKARQEVLDAGKQAWSDYKIKRGDPIVENEYNRGCTKCSFRRTIRDISVIGQEGVKFDTYSNDMWAVRHAALSRFQQAARKLIIRRRAEIKLCSLKDAMIDWSKAKATKSISPLTGDLQEGIEENPLEQEDNVQDMLKLDPGRIKSITFPKYVDPHVKDDMAVDALGTVPVKPTEVTVKKKTPYFDLKVPQHYSLLGYKPHDTHEASLNYVPPKLARSLRTGAEDEIISLPESALSSVLPTPPGAQRSRPAVQTEMCIEEVTGSTPVPEPDSSSEQVSLNPPQALFKPIDYPPLHIFNPSPGLQVFQAPLPYAETDSDFHLCPLPRYINHDPNNPHMATQRKYLDREDTIKGAMSWKKFPCQGLTSLANTPTLTNVWVPRWNDPFSEDLLPQDVPILYDGLSVEDRAQSEEDEESQQEDGAIQLTPDMVNSMFPPITAPPVDDKAKKEAQEMFPHGNRMPPTNVPVSSTGPVPREKRERELEGFMNKKYNRLGNKIQQRINNMNSLKTNRDLVLE